ncbi:unnamed protein product [Hymenolepis diminuta]|uniref:DFDF domain-containing protein n=1 Tax=Hymenolepis diminuta TaxID=6216 RepID=A0A0R3SSU1_HYMDI|nr:unnamed protein product [Hymenolepis diminuta]
MSDNGNFTFQTHPNRQPKVNPFQGKKGETSDPSVLNSGQGANVNARPPTLPNNHHQGSQQSHYQNHRPYPQRGRGGHYGSQNTFGSHSTNRRYSPASHIPNAEDIVNYMDSLWQDFKKEFKESTGVDLQEEVPVQQSSVLQPPMSPRVSGHVNSPHRGQPQQHRYSHQNSTGFGWSVNSGSGNGGRRFSENGEHSSTSSLRRHHNNNNRGGGNYNAPLNNQSWQRGGNFNNRQNSPNSTLNRQGEEEAFRPWGSPSSLKELPSVSNVIFICVGHNGRGLPQVVGRGFISGSRPTPRPIVIATPPPAVSNVAVPPSPSQQQESAVTDMMESLSLKQQPPIESAAVRPQKSSAPAAPSNGNGGRKNVASTDNPKRRRESQSPCTTASSSYHVEFGTAATLTKDHQKMHEESTSVSKTTSDAKSVPTDVQSGSRRRATTTQGAVAGSTCSAPAVLTLSSFLPAAATRHSESASIGSSSFCSLVDQVDVMSTADQYFTPEPPSSPSSVSASVKATGSPTPTND